MRVLDLFCGAGGAGAGYARLGFSVVGVDLSPQKHYPFTFLQADALAVLRGETEIDPRSFDLIHASPPCQGYSPHVSSSGSRWAGTRGTLEPRLIGEVRDLIPSGVAYVIENVAGARPFLHHPLLICGVSVGLPISRHRLFEVSWSASGPVHPSCRGVAVAYAARRGWDPRDMTVTGKGRRAGTSERWIEIMGITHPMTQHEIRESIPPAYAEWIGRSFLDGSSGPLLLGL